jgi:hypothetical protein
MHAPRFEGVPLEKIHVALKLATGLVDTFVDAETGRVCYVPKSTAWAAMEQNEFARWFEEACRVVATRWMHPGVTPEDVRRELIEMVDGRYALEASRS